MKTVVLTTLLALALSTQASAGGIVFDLPTLWFPADPPVTSSTTTQCTSDATLKCAVSDKSGQ